MPAKKQLKVLLATPVYQDMCHVRMAQSVAQLQRIMDMRGDVLQWMTVSATYIQVGRDTLVHRFLHHGDWDKLLFVDSDIFFEPSLGVKLLDYDLDMVAGLYPSKEIYWDGVKKLAPDVSPRLLEHCAAKNMVFRIKEERGKPIKDMWEPLEVTGAATGFMSIKRKVFEKFAKAYPDENYDWGEDGNIIRFFKVGYLPDDPSKLYYGEDMWFCAMVRRLGIKIHVIPAINVKHIGQYIYEGCFFCATGSQIHNLEPGEMAQPPRQAPEEKKETPQVQVVPQGIEWTKEETP